MNCWQRTPLLLVEVVPRGILKVGFYCTHKNDKCHTRRSLTYALGKLAQNLTSLVSHPLLPLMCTSVSLRNCAFQSLGHADGGMDEVRSSRWCCPWTSLAHRTTIPAVTSCFSAGLLFIPQDCQGYGYAIQPHHTLRSLVRLVPIYGSTHAPLSRGTNLVD